MQDFFYIIECSFIIKSFAKNEQNFIANISTIYISAWLILCDSRNEGIKEIIEKKLDI